MEKTHFRHEQIEKESQNQGELFPYYDEAYSPEFFDQYGAITT